MPPSTTKSTRAVASVSINLRKSVATRSRHFLHEVDEMLQSLGATPPRAERGRLQEAVGRATRTAMPGRRVPRTSWRHERRNLRESSRSREAGEERWARSDPGLLHYLPLACVDLLERADPLLRHLIADHAVAFRRELVEVEPHGIVRAGPLGDDPGLQQRLVERPEDVARALHEAAAVLVGPGLEDRVPHPLPVEAELRVDEPLLLRVHQVEEERVEALEGPVLDRVVLGLAELRERGMRPDLAELVVEGLVGHDELADAAEQRVLGDLVERREGTHRDTFHQHL